MNAMHAMLTTSEESIVHKKLKAQMQLYNFCINNGSKISLAQ